MIYIFKFRKLFFEFEFLILKPLDHHQDKPGQLLGHHQTTLDRHWVTQELLLDYRQTTTEPTLDHYRDTLDHHQTTP